MRGIGTQLILLILLQNSVNPNAIPLPTFLPPRVLVTLRAQWWGMSAADVRARVNRLEKLSTGLSVEDSLVTEGDDGAAW
jgi:hypothetical protein